MLWVSLVVAITVTAGVVAHAEEPELVERTFGVLASGGPGPDFEAEDSIAVTVLPDFKNDSNLEFSSTDQAGTLKNTVWLKNDAHHAVEGNSQPGVTYFWLVTEDTPNVPPIGAHTFTGTDSPFIVSQKVVYIAPCNGSCGPENDGKWRIAASGGTAFVIVTAYFSK